MRIRRLLYLALLVLLGALTPVLLRSQPPAPANQVNDALKAAQPSPEASQPDPVTKGALPTATAAPVGNGAAASGAAAAEDEEPLPTYHVGVAVNMVSVPVTVRKADGTFYKGLPESAFKVLEDGVPQEIAFFAQEGLPTHIAMVLDISGSVRSEWGTIKYAATRFLEHLKPDDDFSLVVFNDEIRLKMDWGRKIARVSPVLTSIYCKGNTKLWDAVYVVATDVFKGLDGKKVIIIMSDGLDNQSLVTYEDAVHAAVEIGASIYIVSKTQSLKQYYDYLFPEGVPPQMFAQADAVLRKLAYETGGRVLYPNNFGQLDDIYAEVDDELRNQYTIGYVSTNVARDGSYRKIDVGVKAPGATITARPGYYAQRK